MTDTDSMILHIRSPTWSMGMMQKANEDPHGSLSFDLSKVFGRCQNKGKIGCFEVEEGPNIIHTGVLLMTKMYALDQRGPCGESHEELKGNGIPHKVLELTKTFADEQRMLEEPHADWVELVRIGSHRQRLTHYRQCKKALGCFNDKVFQESPQRAIALGHWRNTTDRSDEPERTIPPVLRQ